MLFESGVLHGYGLQLDLEDVDLFRQRALRAAWGCYGWGCLELAAREVRALSRFLVVNRDWGRDRDKGWPVGGVRVARARRCQAVLRGLVASWFLGV